MEDKDKFKKDILSGLTASQKYLSSKYFYDVEGDLLFQQIMNCPEYYLTNCEREILNEQSHAIINCCQKQTPSFDIVELGAGDASKSISLLTEYAKKQTTVQYYPIDISSHVITNLEQSLPSKIRNLIVSGMAGEYFEMLSLLKAKSGQPKLVLFLGSSIGNMTYEKVEDFLKSLKQLLNPGDLLLTGFDLVKDPNLILKAYNDQGGYTKAFNLNLLKRINKELGGNFELDQFAHAPHYDTHTGACESYLISGKDQNVDVAGQTISFHEDETIFMETSQKFTPQGIQQLADQSNFKSLASFYDKQEWFVDTLWIA